MVFVSKTVATRIIGRVNINAFHLLLVSLFQNIKRLKILRTNQQAITSLI